VTNAALFLDRDGVINIDHGYVYQPQNFEFVPDIFDLVRTARNLGYTEAQFHTLTQWMRQRFEDQNASIDAVYFCPFHPDRKPNPGMFFQAAREHGLDLDRCVLVGDKISDIEAAAAAGIPVRFLFRSTDSCHAAISISELVEVEQFLLKNLLEPDKQ